MSAARRPGRWGLPPANQPGAPRQQPLRPAAPRSRRVTGHGNTRALPNAAPPGRERENIATEITDVFRRQVALGRGGGSGLAGEKRGEGSYGRSRCLPKGDTDGALGSAKAPDVSRRQSRPRAKGTEGTERVGKSRKEPTLTERGVA